MRDSYSSITALLICKSPSSVDCNLLPLIGFSDEKKSGYSLAGKICSSGSPLRWSVIKPRECTAGDKQQQSKTKRSQENGIRNMIKGEIVHLKILLIPFLLLDFLLGVLPVTADGPVLLISFSALAFYIQWRARVHSRRPEFVLRM